MSGTWRDFIVWDVGVTTGALVGSELGASVGANVCGLTEGVVAGGRDGADSQMLKIPGLRANMVPPACSCQPVKG